MSSPVELRFVVDGAPVAIQRPRFDPRTKRTYPDGKGNEYKARVRGEARAAAERELVDGALVRRSPAWPLEDECARARFRRTGEKPPKCACDWCTRTYEVELLVVTADKRKRDLDNIAKGILDGCTGALWRDDAVVQRLAIERAINPARPRVEVVIRVCAGAQLELAAGGGAS